MHLQTLCETDLSGMWSFTPEGGEPTTIRVPGGGWLRQGFACEAGTYEREIEVPYTGYPQAVRLELGAVNHLAEVCLGERPSGVRKIHDEITAFTPQLVDLTPHVRSGGRYTLRIAVRAFRGGRPIAPHWAEWCECIARGIFRDAWLRVYPAVYISDAFVRTFLGEPRFSADVWITNASSVEQEVRLRGEIAAAAECSWPLPSLPSVDAVVPAGATAMLRLGHVPWPAGPESYWWPNVPYRPGYRAVLHWLHLGLTANQVSHSASVRFGFREIRQVGSHYELNGVRVNFRGDNLQVANYDRVDCGGKGDAVDTLPGFLPPSADNPGWPQAVDNFLRLGYNVQREHMGPWAPYMIDVCDEMGLMLIGESATRWDGFDMERGRGFHEVKCLRDIVRRDRNHPSIVRWSAKNEPQCLDPEYHAELYEAIRALDDTRPVSEDIVIFDRRTFDPLQVFSALLDKPDFTWIEHYLTYDEQGAPRFSAIEHNDAVVPLHDRPYGLGEADWMRSSTPAGLAWFATTVALARAQGASDVRPYVLLSSWVSSVPGVRTMDLLNEENRHPVYGDDNLPDPWAHPGIQLLQRACHPLLALDVDFWQTNRRADPWGHFPTVAPQVVAGTRVERIITVFNDEFAGSDLILHWDVREGSPSNRPCAEGSAALRIEPGRTGKTTIEFDAPRYNTHVFLTLSVSKEGVERFRDDLTAFEIVGGQDFRPEFEGQEKQFL